jgi:hypothetical protein
MRFVAVHCMLPLDAAPLLTDSLWLQRYLIPAGRI